MSGILRASEAIRSGRLSRHPPETAAPDEASARASAAAQSIALRALEAFAYSSGLAAAIGLVFSLLASRMLAAPQAWTWAALAAAGAFVVYNVDRLRDLERDGRTSPRRTAFVSRHRVAIGLGVGVGALVIAVVLLRAPGRIVLLCLAIGVVGSMHRRMKHNAAWKAIYVSAAWVAGCVGVPWLAARGGGAAREGGAVAWIAGILFASLLANLVASSLRDDEALLQRTGSPQGAVRALWVARGSTLVAIAIAGLAPAPIRPLVWVPVCEAVALVRFRSTERYGHVAIDGALLVGALVAIAHAHMV
jgi:4-hydroxybenzoate polyprenyltransferase